VRRGKDAEKQHSSTPPTACCSYSTTLNIKGERYRHKEKRHVGLLSRTSIAAELEVTGEP